MGGLWLLQQKAAAAAATQYNVTTELLSDKFMNHLIILF